MEKKGQCYQGYDSCDNGNNCGGLDGGRGMLERETGKLK